MSFTTQQKCRIYHGWASADEVAGFVKLRICEGAAPGSRKMEVGNFGDSSGQFFVLFWFPGQFFHRKKTKNKPILAKKLSKML